jgi:hypothetical protein
MFSDETKAAICKVGIAWIGGFAGMKLSDWVLLATLIYTVLQIIILLKNDRRKDK